MAWVLVTGEDRTFFEGILNTVRPVGHAVVVTPDGATALQLLRDISRQANMVVLLRHRMGQTSIGTFVQAVEADSDVRWRHAYLLVRDPFIELPAHVERHVDQLVVTTVAAPDDASDVDGWADVLDAIELAARQLPTSQTPRPP